MASSIAGVTERKPVMFDHGTVPRSFVIPRNGRAARSRPLALDQMRAGPARWARAAGAWLSSLGSPNPGHTGKPWMPVETLMGVG